MKFFYFLFFLSCYSISIWANPTLNKKYNCNACHLEKGKSLGPSYEQVAKKYKDQKEAVSVLGERVKKGSNGVWGNIPMPPTPKISDEELKNLMKWVLIQ